MKMIFIVIFIIILIPSCRKKNGFVDESIPFVITVETPAKNPIDYMESLHVVSYMALETRSNNLLKNIKRVFVTDSSLVLFDDELHRIMLFSPKGEYLHDIGRRGAASDEYVGLNDVVYYNGNVYAHDRMRQRMLIYDLAGNLEQSHTSAFNFNSFCKTEAGYWIYSCFKKNNPNGSNLMLVDDEMQVMQAEYFPQDDHFVNVNFASRFDMVGEEVYFNYPTSNIIYRLEDRTVKPYCQIDFGVHTPDYERISLLKDVAEYWNYMESAEAYAFSDVMVWNDFVYCAYSQFVLDKPTTLCYAMGNLKIGKVTCYNRVYNSCPVLPKAKLVGHSDKHLIFAVNCFLLSPQEFDFLKKECGIEVDTDSNPLLLFVDLL